MNVSTQDVGDSTIVNVNGKLTIGRGDVELRDLIAELHKKGRNKIALDLSGVTTIDSSGLSELVKAYTTIANAGGRIVLTGLPTKLNELLHVTQLISVFEMADNSQDALKLLKN